MVEVAALGVAVVLRAAMVLGAARVFVVVVVRLPEVNEVASYAVVVHLQSPAAATGDEDRRVNNSRAAVGDIQASHNVSARARRVSNFDRKLRVEGMGWGLAEC
ncbi:hypothetical protein ACOMHN_032391 [Nucella lapillus]